VYRQFVIAVKKKTIDYNTRAYERTHIILLHISDYLVPISKRERRQAEKNL
jgi:hypothetical protein